MNANHPNAEAINDRTKLLYHRLVARRLKREPELVAEALLALDRRAEQFGHGHDTVEWRALLQCPINEIRAVISSRSRAAARFRISSPFYFVESLSISDLKARRRLREVANRAFRLPLER